MDDQEKQQSSTQDESKQEKLHDLQKECNALIKELEVQQESPEKIVKTHIQHLKKYKELKDVALSLVSMIADQRQLSMRDILEEMKVELGDDQ